jgi:tetratricopeptide (TPR) repeat protein
VGRAVIATVLLIGMTLWIGWTSVVAALLAQPAAAESTQQAPGAQDDGGVSTDPAYQRGLELLKMGHWASAVPALTEAVEAHPTAAAPYAARARAQAQLGDYDAAFADFDAALLLEPGRAVRYDDRGLVRELAGDGQGALTDFGQAIQLDPSYASAYFHRGRHLWYTFADLDVAFADFDQVIRLQPDNAMAYFFRGMIRPALGLWHRDGTRDDAGAVADFDQAIRLAPDYAPAYYYRGLARLNLQDQQGARQDLDVAAALYQQQGDAAGQQRAAEALSRLR